MPRAKKKRVKIIAEKQIKLAGKVTPNVPSPTPRSWEERQLIYIVAGMVVLLLVAIGMYCLVNSQKKFVYGGLEFEKILYGKLPVYHSRIPITDGAGSLVANYNLYLRNDPRSLEYIPIDSNIRLASNTFVSIDPEANAGCEDSGIAGGSFFTFLKVAGVDAKMAYTNETYAVENNLTYATCSSHPSTSGVIVITKGDKSRITKISDSCYEIQFKGCEILNATERFIVASFANSKGMTV